jgi:Acetyltransferase (GNAT) domain
VRRSGPTYRPGTVAKLIAAERATLPAQAARSADQELGTATQIGPTGKRFLPLSVAWGCGYAAEACVAALDWFAGAFPSEPVVLCTQTANDRSMRLAAKLGFTEVERFEEYGAEQWFGVWSSVAPSG